MTLGTTKLEAVNRLLRMISQSPVTNLKGAIGLDSGALDALDYSHREVCLQQWPFCTEEKDLQPNSDGEILIGNNVLGVLLLNSCDRETYIVRGSRLYNKKEDTGFKINKIIPAQLTILVPWDDMQEHQRQFVLITAARTWVRDKVQDPTIISAINNEWAITKTRFLSVEMGNHPVNLLDGDLSGWQRSLAGNYYTGSSWPY